MNKRLTKIQVCLNCPEPECISDDWGCAHLIERQGLIQTAKIHNGRGGLRIVGVVE